MHLHRRISLFLIVCSLAFISYTCSDSSTGPKPRNGNGNSNIEFNSKAAPGDSAKSFLEGDQYTTLQLEIDYMPGYEPTRIIHEHIMYGEFYRS